MISFNGYNENTLTFQGTATVGYPVKISDGLVADAENGEDFIGIAVGVHGDYVVVQLDGYVEMSTDGSSFSYGYGGILATGDGNVTAVSTESTSDSEDESDESTESDTSSSSSTSTAHEYKIIKIDSDNNTVGFIL